MRIGSNNSTQSTSGSRPDALIVEVAAGIPTVRLTELRLDQYPEREAARLLKILADREPD